MRTHYLKIAALICLAFVACCNTASVEHQPVGYKDLVFTFKVSVELGLIFW